MTALGYKIQSTTVLYLHAAVQGADCGIHEGLGHLVFQSKSLRLSSYCDLSFDRGLITMWKSGYSIGCTSTSNFSSHIHF